MHWHHTPSRPPSDDGPPDDSGEQDPNAPSPTGDPAPFEAGQPGEPAHRGRPRSAEADAAITRATLRILADVGYEGLSIEGVAAAAGVGKTTVYRRYRSKAELVLATMTQVDRDAGPPPRDALGSISGTREALRFMIRGAAVIISTPGVLPALSNLIAGPGQDTELAPAIRGQVFGPNIDLLRGRIEAGIDEGEVRPDAAADAAIDAAFGALIARSLRGGVLDEAWQEEVLDTLWRGIEARRDGAGPFGDGRAAPPDPA